MEKKICITCKEEKELDQFIERPNYNKSGVKYYNSNCKECCVKLTREWRKENREEHKAYQREYFKKKKA
jgi:hypothetical protein